MARRGAEIPEAELARVRAHSVDGGSVLRGRGVLAQPKKQRRGVNSRLIERGEDSASNSATGCRERRLAAAGGGSGKRVRPT